MTNGEAAAAPAVDPALLRAIPRGHRWFAKLASGRARDSLEIAKREGLHDSHVRRLIPYAFLAPSIVEAICEGRQPAELTAERLTRRAKLPLQWAEQQPRMDPAEGGPLDQNPVPYLATKRWVYDQYQS